MSKKQRLEQTLEIIARKVKELRASTGLSQEEFAQKCGWDNTMQSRIEAGEQTWKLKLCLSLAMLSTYGLMFHLQRIEVYYRAKDLLTFLKKVLDFIEMNVYIVYSRTTTERENGTQTNPSAN